ncbi:PLP-dependent aminotransferase family protein [Pseudoflavitalea rhizosphaerae]|uniref:aminotransferase-like domain-containing protein n=1 Tax=Pseudoflavitalea rhizosphaerae TaxID=1884793 RepID=UPI0019D260A9|nr:PLP-dependent aminotransferase family protein [Pseudoflavitalea rhizosphaerae]
MKDFIYQEISGKIAKMIRAEVLKPGERLPSVRMLCQEHGISMNTAKRIFMELEAQSLIESRPQSGYFVSRLSYLKLPLPGVSKPAAKQQKEAGDLIERVSANMGNEKLTLFSVGAPVGPLLPLAKLNKEIQHATRALPEGGAAYEPLQGNEKLRRMIAARSLTWGGSLQEDELITTTGGLNAIAYCLMALGKPGDTVAIESPCYPGILQLALSLGLKVLELPTHPVTGIEMDALKRYIPKIDICLLISNFNTPLGSCMPEENKKEVVQLLGKHDIPLIEDDVYGELCFGPQRPVCCKAFDTEGNVLWCSSLSKTLAPGYRVGWIAPGKYRERILKQKLVHTISGSSITQEAAANFLKSARYDIHLRHLRKTLFSNYQYYVDAIAQYFPEGTRTSRPQGGLALWVEFDKGLDTVELYELAMKQKISIAPGRMFTLQEQYHNCMRLCYGLPWTDELKLKLKKLGALAKMVHP